MKIKEIVKDLCTKHSKKRVDFIKDFLTYHHIAFNELKYNNITNIEVCLEGITKDEEVIFFAHHDISSQTKEGANDNSSSVAVMLNVLLSLKKSPPHYTIKIIFNDTEEILGGLLNQNIPREQMIQIITNAGSYQYLKRHNNFKKIKAVFILELSGIGDAIFIADRSGMIECSQQLNFYLNDLARKKNYNYINIPILSSDMVSVKTFGLNGTVYGAIPVYQAKNFLNIINKQQNKYQFTTDIMPSSWNNIHTTRDNIFAINEKALLLINNFTLDIIKNISLLKPDEKKEYQILL